MDEKETDQQSIRNGQDVAPNEDTTAEDTAKVDEAPLVEVCDIEDTGGTSRFSGDAVAAPVKPSFDAVGTVLEYLEILAFSVVAVLVVFTMLFRLCRVDGSSMRKTLENGQMLITTSVGEVKQGDIIVFSMTTERPEYDKLNEALVKRVIAKSGQTVRIDCNTGNVYVDGQQLDETYAVLLDGEGRDIGKVQQLPMYNYDRQTRIFEATVPEGCLFVMGDNRNHSTDSRTTAVGMVDERRVLGRVVLRIAPFTTDFD